MLFFAYCTRSSSSHKRVLPVVDVPTLLLIEDTTWLDVADVAVVVVTEDASKIRDRFRVRNLKITRTPSFEIPRLYRILIGTWNLKQIDCSLFLHSLQYSSQKCYFEKYTVKTLQSKIGGETIDR